MAQEPESGAGQDGDAALPGAVTPDWVDDEDWARMCEARAADDGSDVTGDDWDAWAPDPEDGPPPEWAGVSLAELTAQAETDAIAHAALMARLQAAGVGDGYAHRRGDPPVPGVFTGPAAGFGQARYLDGALPESALAMLADDASGEDRSFTDVTDDQLLGLLGARRRLEARQAWERLMVVAELIRRRPKPGCRLVGPARMPRVWHESAAGELRTHLHLSPQEADAMLGLAHDLLVKLPLTSAALRDGMIDLARAQLIAARCLGLTPAEARAVEKILFGDPGVGEWSRAVFRDRVARAAIQVNPQAAIRLREEAAKTRRVEVRAEFSGNATIAGRELPPAAALAASQLLTARARELRQAGLAGGMDELRVLAYLERLGVADPLCNTQGNDNAQDTDNARQNGNAPDPSGSSGSGPADPDSGPADPDSGPANPSAAADTLPGMVPGGFAARVNMTLPLATLLNLAERPGTMPGLGPIDPALVRGLAAAAARNPASTWCLTITDPQGRPVAHGCGRPPPPSNPSKHKHTSPHHQTRDGPAVTPGSPDDHGPPGGSGTIRLSTAPLTGTPGGGAGAGPDLVFALETLAGPCDHKHQAKGHDPGRMLRHLTGILNDTCTLPPCRRPASQSDYEHSTPFHEGGKTCLCEAGPVCRTDHRHKQSPGWRLEQAGSRGWFRWTTPSGRTYISGPTQYPA
jgi:Domain of unknown function (DUF222)